MARDIQQIVEKQVAVWREEQRLGAGQQTREQSDVLVISYATGSNGAAIGDRVAGRLGLLHHDHEIVEHIASTAKVHLQTVESLDKHVQSRIDESIAALFTERNFDRSDYLRLLGRTVVALFEHGPCVISGHGAVHFVPRRHALTARLTAPVEVRARRLAAKRNIDLDRARRDLHRADSEQAAFHRRFFGADVNDPDHYDLIVDTAWLDEAAVAALLAQAYRLRFQAPGSGE